MSPDRRPSVPEPESKIFLLTTNTILRGLEVVTSPDGRRKTREAMQENNPALFNHLGQMRQDYRIGGYMMYAMLSVQTEANNVTIPEVTPESLRLVNERLTRVKEANKGEERAGIQALLKEISTEASVGMSSLISLVDTGEASLDLIRGLIETYLQIHTVATSDPLKRLYGFESSPTAE